MLKRLFFFLDLTICVLAGGWLRFSFTQFSEGDVEIAVYCLLAFLFFYLGFRYVIAGSAKPFYWPNKD